jgi:hypothetical protein
MNFWYLWKVENVLTSCGAVAFSRSILIHVVGGADNFLRDYNLILSQKNA